MQPGNVTGLTVAAPQKTSRSREGTWDPSAAPPLDSLCPPSYCGSACSARTGQLCPLWKKEGGKKGKEIKSRPVSGVAPTEMLHD